MMTAGYLDEAEAARLWNLLWLADVRSSTPVYIASGYALPGF